jgi:hypothetical protein
MPSKESVRSVEEWLELPELSAPRIRSERDDGAVVTLKVGFLAVSQENYRKARNDRTGRDWRQMLSSNGGCRLGS